MRRVKRIAQVAAYAVLLVTAAACGSEETADGSDVNHQDLSGDWTLVAATANGTPFHLDDTHPVTLTFDGSDVSGTSACNSYSGKVRAEGIGRGLRPTGWHRDGVHPAVRDGPRAGVPDGHAVGRHRQAGR